MFLNQLSVFLENREGRLDQVLEILKDHNINIVSLSLADTSDFGLLRLIVEKPEEARAALKAAGISAMLTPVLGVDLAHEVGSLQAALSALCKEGINVEYMYALATANDNATIVIKTTDLQKSAAVLEGAGIPLVKVTDIEG